MKAVTFKSTVVRYLACKMLGLLWPGTYWSHISGLRLAEVPAPELPTAHWVRLRTILGGICGTDLAAIFLRAHPASFLQSLAAMPYGLGHECVAVIDEVGRAVTDYKPGDRVVIEPSLSCAAREIDPSCAPCAAGNFTLCENLHRGTLPPAYMTGYNNFTGGSWGERFVAHSWQLHRVPDSLPDEQAVLTDPLACSLHGVLRHRPADNHHALVQGGGIIALGTIAALRALRCRAEVTALVYTAFQEELARKLGADHVIRHAARMPSRRRYDDIAGYVGGRRVPGLFGNQGLFGGFDTVYSCAGGGAALTDAAKFTRARGTLVILGTGSICVFDSTPLWFAELNVIGCNGRQIEEYDGRRLHTYRVLFELIERGAFDPAAFPTRTYPLSEYRAALRDLVHPPTPPFLKALLDPNRT
ncbi:MAG: zinc-binding dehydrogenase [Phycisphaerales bacterium]|nr:MAG: zinc-binding dehydrogenase [Phycisphaerales bacterium]